MGDIEKQLTHLMKESAKAPSTLYDHIHAFTSAIDWSETWIRSMLAFHIVFLVLALYFRKNLEIQAFIFATITLVSISLHTSIHEHAEEHAK